MQAVTWTANSWMWKISVVIGQNVSISYKGRILAHERWYDTDSRVFLWISRGLKKGLSHQQCWCERIEYGGCKCAQQPSGTDMMPSAGRHLVEAMFEGINVKYCAQCLWWIIVFVWIEQEVQWMRPSETYKQIKKERCSPQYFSNAFSFTSVDWAPHKWFRQNSEHN